MGKSFLEEAQDLFKYDAFSKSVQDWNTLRSDIVETCFDKILFPMLRKELRLRLTREAKDGLKRQVRKARAESSDPGPRGGV